MTRSSARLAVLVLAVWQGPAMAAGTTAPQSSLAGLSPEQRMQRRYPQPVKVGDLIGLPVLDDRDRTLGRIRAVVRTAAGKIQLIVPYGGVFGFGARFVAVPIEVVGIAGRQLAALDMDRTAFGAAPAWSAGEGTPLAPSETIHIALYKR